jgi:hypothetical protein
MLMLSGFFSNADNFAPYLIPIKYLSLFKWGYQIMIYNEVDGNLAYTCSNPPSECLSLGDLEFKESKLVSYIILSTLVVVYTFLGYIGVYYLVKIKR